MATAIAVDRETLRRIYAKHMPTKLGDIEGILAKRVGDQRAMHEMYVHLSQKFGIDAVAMRQKTQQELAVASPKKPVAPVAGAPIPPPAPATPAKVPTVAAAAAPPAATLTVKKAAPQAPSVGSPPKVPGKSASPPSASAAPDTAGSPAGSPGRSARKETPLEAATTARARRLLARQGTDKAGAAEALVRTIVDSKAGLNEQTANDFIRSLEKRLGYTEADVLAAAGGAEGGTGGGDSTSAVAPSTAVAGAAAGSAAAALLLSPGKENVPAGDGGRRALDPKVETMLRDAFGAVPDPRPQAGGGRRAPMTAEERTFYEQLALPSVLMACPDQVADAMAELFGRCELGALPPALAASCTTTRDVADRAVHALQAKYELRHPAGRQDFFAKFMPRSRVSEAQEAAAAAAARQQLLMQRQSHQEQAAAAAVSVTPDANPMTVSRLIAQHTLASSMIDSSAFLGTEAGGVFGGDGTTASELGPLPGGAAGRQVQQPPSFSALLVSAMQFLDSNTHLDSSAPPAHRDILPATFVVEYLDWADVADKTEARRDMFKLALAQDVADVFGWGDLLDGAGGGTTPGRHTWRNISVKRFTLSTAGNVHAECEVVVPAGISTDDLCSLVHARLRGGGFTLPRSRLSLARDLEARPAKLFCRSATFGSAHPMEGGGAVFTPDSVFDASLGVNMSPHRDAAAPSSSLRTPLLGMSPYNL